MKALTVILVLAVLPAAFLVAPALGLRGGYETRIWGLSAATVLAFGHVLAKGDQAQRPEEEKERYRYMGFIPGVTSALSRQSAKTFCAAMSAWFACLAVRTLFHFYA